MSRAQRCCSGCTASPGTHQEEEEMTYLLPRQLESCL